MAGQNEYGQVSRPLPPRSAALILAAFVVSVALPTLAAQPETPAPVQGLLANQPGSSTDVPGTQSAPAASGSHYQFYRPADALRDAADPLVATLDGRDIYLSAVGDAYNDLPEASKQQPFDLAYPTLLQGLISQSALAMEAQRRHLDDDRDVRRHIARAIDLVLANEVLGRAVAEQVTEQAIRQRYQQIYGEKSGVDEIRLRVIVLRTRAEADQVADKISHGADFAALARQSSIDPSGVNGGDIGFVQRQQLPPLIADAVFKLGVGATTATPLSDQQAWEIFKLEERRIAPAPTFPQARDSLRQQLVEEVIRNKAMEARSKLQVRAYNIDGTPFEPPDQSLLDQPFNFDTVANPGK